MIYGWQLCFLYVSCNNIPQEDLYPVDAYPQKYTYCRDILSYIREQIKMIKDDKEVTDELRILFKQMVILKYNQKRIDELKRE